MSFLLKILNIVPSSAKNRIFNRFTTQGGLLLLFVLAEQGVISKDAIKALEGVPNIHVWVLGALIIYLLLKAPKAYKESKLEKRKYAIQIKELALKNKELDLKILKIKNEEKLTKKGA